MSIRTKYLIGVVLLSIVDMVIPFPILGTILVYVMIQKPLWFRSAAEELYKDR